MVTKVFIAGLCPEKYQRDDDFQQGLREVQFLMKN